MTAGRLELTCNLPDHVDEFAELDPVGHDERFARPLVRWKADQAFDKGGKVAGMSEDHGLRAIAWKDAHFVLQIEKHGPGHHRRRLGGIGHAEIVEKQPVSNEGPCKMWVALELFDCFQLKSPERQLDPPARKHGCQQLQPRLRGVVVGKTHSIGTLKSRWYSLGMNLVTVLD